MGLFRERQAVDWFLLEPRYESLRLFESYLHIMEHFLEQEAQDSHSKLREFVEDVRTGKYQYERQEDVSIEQGMYERDIETVDGFTNILRKSFLVSLYTFLESWLVEECDARKGDDILLKLSDLRGDELDKVKTYMIKVLQASFPSTSPEWQRIQVYRVLRNCIVHNEGKLDEGFDQRDSKSLKNYIANTPTLSLSGEEVILAKDFCEEALKTVEQFFRLLYS